MFVTNFAQNRIYAYLSNSCVCYVYMYVCKYIYIYIYIYIYAWNTWKYIIVCNRPVSWGYRICRPHLCSRVRPPPPSECPVYDTNWSDGEFWGMWNAFLLPLLPGSFWPRVRVPSMREIELFNHLTVSKQVTDVKLNSYCYIAILETI